MTDFWSRSGKVGSRNTGCGRRIGHDLRELDEPLGVELVHVPRRVPGQVHRDGVAEGGHERVVDSGDEVELVEGVHPRVLRPVAVLALVVGLVLVAEGVDERRLPRSPPAGGAAPRPRRAPTSPRGRPPRPSPAAGRAGPPASTGRRARPRGRRAGPSARRRRAGRPTGPSARACGRRSAASPSSCAFTLRPSSSIRTSKVAVRDVVGAPSAGAHWALAARKEPLGERRIDGDEVPELHARKAADGPGERPGDPPAATGAAGAPGRGGAGSDRSGCRLRARVVELLLEGQDEAREGARRSGRRQTARELVPGVRGDLERHAARVGEVDRERGEERDRDHHR